MTYKIYHIPGVKIGMTKYIESRIRQQGFKEYEILEEHEDEAVAEVREVELQRQYNYPVNGKYSKTVRHHLTHEDRVRGGKNSPFGTFEVCSKGGLKGGQTNKESGHMSRLGSQWKGKTQKTMECPHCGKVGGNAMKRWHFDNCKNKN
jgi:hypothetical protein